MNLFSATTHVQKKSFAITKFHALSFLPIILVKYNVKLFNGELFREFLAKIFSQ